ncbi:hypothetical protein AA0117_g6220 [Alternaria alternata]|uniref:Uncharacterized protein n=1 Tax=Alternaria alternata TaxID=5599 RepID=A0A4Q4NGB5_ALTAL|nr:hypothetical protein AA0117_g6220 [Alternaria alternata]
MAQSQPEWNAQFERYTYTFYDSTYGRYYWKHYVPGQGWEFFNWVPVPVTTEQSQSQLQLRMDSVQTMAPSGAGPSGKGGGATGETIQGSYNPQNPQPNSHYELLDPC